MKGHHCKKKETCMDNLDLGHEGMETAREVIIKQEAFYIYFFELIRKAM